VNPRTMAKYTAAFLIALSALALCSAGPSNKEWKEGQQKDADNKAAAGANEAKMAAVNKVVSMLEDLQAQVLKEGEDEAATYNKFACFCKTAQKDKSDSISQAKTDKESLSSDINKFSKQRDDLDDKIARKAGNIKAAEKAMKKRTEDSDAAQQLYETNNADLKAALASITEATKVLKASKSPSLLQVQSVGQSVKQALLMADALGLETEGVQSFLQSGDVPVEMEDYKFHSSGIVTILEKLLGDFRAEKNTQDADEVKRVQEYTVYTQDRTDYVKAQTLSMEQAKAKRDGKIEDIGAANQELTTVSAQYAGDMIYLDELNKICSDKAKTWDQRSKLRANELTAITQATGIVKATVSEKTASATLRFAETGSVVRLADAVVSSDSAMQAIEAQAEIEEADTPLGFLQKKAQRHMPSDDGREVVTALLKNKGRELKSTLLMSLATKLAADPLAKVKNLIQELIERLLTEAAEESNKKGYCVKATADAKQKRTNAADATENLNAKMAKLAALSDKLEEEIKHLKDEINKLNENVRTAEQERADEKKENANTVVEANAGREAVNMAIDILDKFYKTSAKAKVDLSLSQKGPLDDAPDAGFDNGEAYQGAGAESGGIIGMMEVIRSDFERTISETKAAEANAAADHHEFMTNAGISKAEDTMAAKQNQRLKDEADKSFNDAEDDLTFETKILVQSIHELVDLKAECIDTGMSYEDRVAMREQEIESLKKALCIFGAYAQYGPDGLADAC